ncbi:MAG: sigma 54-interacting transcriptional regulator [bacterium]|nr:sigma 54-interacting transcriptional regulator [bacterium]
MSRILVIDDDKGVCDFFDLFLNKEGHDVKTIQLPSLAMSVLQDWTPEIIFLDQRMPEMDGLTLLPEIKKASPSTIVIFITAFASVESAVDAIRKGAFDYITKPFKIDEIRLVLKRAVETYTLREENITLKKTLEQVTSYSLIGESKIFMDILELVHKVANTDSTILLYGESGTGKELIAREIHNVSLRKNNPFIPINCGALSESLLESELFGYVKGAFTGAVKDKIGLFQASDKGTLFLDEITSATPKIQVELLRVIESKEITRVGSTGTIPVNVRLILATNQKLEQLVKEGKFREDLYYRINVIPVTLPSLRERKDDIPLLVEYFLNKYSTKHKLGIKKMHPDTMKLLNNYNWPGNIRELENVIERAVILEKSDIILPDSLPDKIKQTTMIAQTLSSNYRQFAEKYAQEDLHKTEGFISKEQQILDYLKENSKITSNICSEMLNVSPRMARNYLQGLLDKKLILQQGTAKKNTYYTLAN